MMDDDSPDNLLAMAEGMVLSAEETANFDDAPAEVKLQRAQVYALMSIAASLSEIAKLS